MRGNRYADLPIWQQALWILATICLLVVMERQFQNYLGKRAIVFADLPVQSLGAALEKSREDGKPVLANFSALWCAPCRKLAREVLSNGEVRRELIENFHYSRLEFEDEADREWFNRFGVSGFPTLLLIHRGDIERLQTSTTPEALLSKLRSKTPFHKHVRE